MTKSSLLVKWERTRLQWRGYGRPWVLEYSAPIDKCNSTRQKDEVLGMPFPDHPVFLLAFGTVQLAELRGAHPSVQIAFLSSSSGLKHSKA